MIFIWFVLLVYRRISFLEKKNHQTMDFLSGLIFLSPDLSCRDTSSINPQSTTSLLPPPPPQRIPRRIDLWPWEGIRETPPEVQGSSSCQTGSVCCPDCFMMETRRDNIYPSRWKRLCPAVWGGGSNRLIATKVSGVTLRRAALALRYDTHVNLTQGVHHYFILSESL